MDEIWGEETDGGGDHQTPIELPAPVPEEWLAQFIDLDAARHLRAIERDTDRMTELMYSGFSGRPWRELEKWLIPYGVAVIAAWAETGRLPGRVAARGLGHLPRTSRYRDSAEATSLANETVAAALGAFRNRVLIPGIWDASRGATLRTFFIGQCLLQVRNPYRRGLRSYENDALTTAEPVGTPASGGISLLGKPTRDPADVAAARDQAARALAQLPNDRSRRIVALRADDLADREIAARAGVSEDSVRKTLYSVRKRHSAA